MLSAAERRMASNVGWTFACSMACAMDEFKIDGAFDSSPTGEYQAPKKAWEESLKIQAHALVTPPDCFDEVEKP